MRISDWSSDVCSSDLAGVDRLARAARPARRAAPALRDHRARPQLALALQRGDDPGRARDLRLRNGARLSASALPAHRSDEAAGGSTRHRPGGVPVRILARPRRESRSEAHTSELQSLMSISYAVFCLKKKKNIK